MVIETRPFQLTVSKCKIAGPTPLNRDLVEDVCLRYYDYWLGDASAFALFISHNLRMSCLTRDSSLSQPSFLLKLFDFCENPQQIPSPSHSHFVSTFASLAMSPATVELDFFGLERKQNTSSRTQFKKFPRQGSFRDIQGAISKINPEIIKSVIASGSARPSMSLPSTPKDEPGTFSALPLFRQTQTQTQTQTHMHIRRSDSENVPETAPLTIFYNGTVSVFDVSRQTADCILKLAVEGNSKDRKQQLLQTLYTGDLPIARRKSLQRFLEKRKERLMSASPYSCQLSFE